MESVVGLGIGLKSGWEGENRMYKWSEFVMAACNQRCSARIRFKPSLIPDCILRIPPLFHRNFRGVPFGVDWGLSSTNPVFKYFQGLEYRGKNSRTFKDAWEPCIKHILPRLHGVPKKPKKWHPCQLRQYNVVQTKKHQIFTLFEQFQHSLLLFHRVMDSICPLSCCTTRRRRHSLMLRSMKRCDNLFHSSIMFCFSWSTVVNFQLC